MAWRSCKRLPQTHAEAVATLGSRESKEVANNTRLHRREGGAVALRLHETDILTWRQNGDRVLNSGGWKTATTKARLRDAGIDLYHHKNRWTIGGCEWTGGDFLLYADGMVLHPDGTATGAGTQEAAKAAAKLRREVANFAYHYARKLAAGEIEAPSVGDCFYCAMRDVETGLPMPGADHLLSHIKEPYYVPSLLLNALTANGCTPTGAGSFWYQGALALMGAKDSTGATASESQKENIRRMGSERFAAFLRKYMIAELQKGGAL